MKGVLVDTGGWMAKLTTVITTDHHFQQVGFDVLPAPPTKGRRKPRLSR